MAERSDLVLGMKAEQGDVIRIFEKVADSLKRLEDRLDGVGDEADDAKKKVKTFGEKAEGVLNKVGKVAKYVAAAGIAAFTATMYKAVGAASSLETKLAEVSTLLGDKATPQMRKYEKAIRDLSTRTSASAKELTAGLYQVISAGTKGTETVAGSMELLETAQKAAVAGLSDTFSAVDVLTTALNSYGQSTEMAGRFSDILFTTVRLGKINFQQLSSSIGIVTSSAASAGVSFEEVNAAIAAMTALGVPVERAITGMNGIIRVAAKGTKELDKAIMDQLGTTTADILETKGLTGVLEALNKVTGGSVVAMQQLGIEQEAIQGLSVLAGTGIDKFKTSLDVMAGSAGATETAYQKMSKTFEESKKRFWNKLEDLLVSLGQEVLPDLIDAMEAFGNWITNNKDDIVRAFGGIKAAVGAIVDLIMDGVHGLRLFLYWLGVVEDKYGGKKVATFGGEVVSEVPFPERLPGAAGAGKTGKPRAPRFGGGKAAKALGYLGEGGIAGMGAFGFGFGQLGAMAGIGTEAIGMQALAGLEERRRTGGLKGAEAIESYRDMRAAWSQMAYEKWVKPMEKPSFWKNVAKGFAEEIGSRLVDVMMVALDVVFKPYKQIMDLFGLAMGGAGVEEVAQQTDQMIQFWENLAQNLGPVLDYLIKEGIPRIIDSFVEHLPTIVDAITERIPDIIAAVIHRVPDIAWALAKAVAQAIGNLLTFGGGLDFTSEWGEAVPILGHAAGFVVDVAKGIGEWIGSWFHEGGFVSAADRLNSGAVMFTKAVKAHTGLFVRPGLSAGDVPAILQEGEGVIRREVTAAMGGEAWVNAMNSGRFGGGMNVHFHTEHLYTEDAPQAIDRMQSELVRRGTGRMRRVIGGGAVPGWKPRRS